MKNALAECAVDGKEFEKEMEKSDISSKNDESELINDVEDIERVIEVDLKNIQKSEE